MSAIDDYEAKFHLASVGQVVRVTELSPHMRRFTFHCADLAGLIGHWRPEMLVRLYFPPEGRVNPPEPYLSPDGVLEFHTEPGVEVSPFSAVSEDPLVRAYTGRAFRPSTLELDIDFVLHEEPGLASDWARRARIGDRLGMVEFQLPPGHRPAVGRDADVFIMLADEAALPAFQTNLEAFPAGAKVIAFLEVANAAEEQPIQTRADLTVRWLHRGDAAAGASGLLLQAIRDMAWPTGKVFVWACCDIKSATMIRKFVKQERGLVKGESKTQAYWRHGKTEVERMARMTELSMAAALQDPQSFQESFEEIGMNIEDPTLVD